MHLFCGPEPGYEHRNDTDRRHEGQFRNTQNAVHENTDQHSRLLGSVLGDIVGLDQVSADGSGDDEVEEQEGKWRSWLEKSGYRYTDELDIAICESVQRGLGSSAYDVGRYAPRVEEAEHHFHSMLAGELLGSGT